MLILYSSGTTGRPKGVMLTNENLSYIPVMARRLFHMTPDSVHLIVAPLFHIGGAGTGLTTTTLGGRTVVLQDANPELILETIERERVTHAFFVPAIIQRLIEAQSARERDLESLRYIAYGGAPMTETLLRGALDTLGCGFVGCYGMTETAGTVTALPPAEHATGGPQARLLRSVGRQLPWHEVRVTDLQTGDEAAPGVSGEIWVRSAMNMKGYFNQADATAQTLVADGWLRTGDGAYRDEDGYFFLTDRLKDMIISGGENVYPAEVENILAGHPAVSEAAVIGVPHAKWGETVKAVVALRSGHELSAPDLIAYARGELAHYKCPTSVEFMAELPRNPAGKIIKKTLREMYSGEEALR
jgi:long-chain acyl-CoA synthetase